MIDEYFEWMKAEQDPTINIDDIDKYLEFNNRYKYNEYEPCLYSDEFRVRLHQWLKNFEGYREEQKQMFLFTKDLSFISRLEMNALYRSAFTNVFLKWVIDIGAYTFSTKELEKVIEDDILHTWFCPGSDSMRISQFFHINDINSKIRIRPDWYSLAALNSETDRLVNILKDYTKKKEIKNLVIIEDFVGSGTQIKKSLILAAKTELNVLFIPLIMCFHSQELFDELTSEYKNLRINPIVVLAKDNFLKDTPREGEPAVFAGIRKLSQEIFTSRLSPCPDYIKPFGFENMGNLCILFSNCPNNSLPIIFHKTPSWVPLFPRAGRGG